MPTNSPLEAKLKQLPTQAGIYQYFDKDGKLLYIGKAKILKNRVKSYFKFTPTLSASNKLSMRIYKMISEVYDINWIVVDNENDALILENSLIKQLKPKYNILLRDDKTYPYICVDYNEKFPRLTITRKVLKNSKIKYFGPFSTGAKDMLDTIYEILPLVQKKSCVDGGKACLFYQIKKCLAPCEAKVTQEQYQKILQKAIYYIHNKSALINLLYQKIEQYSEQFRFEEALVLRDRIKSIQKSQIKSTLDIAKDEDYDLFVAKQDNTKVVVLKMFIREGKLISTDHHFVNITEDTNNLDELYKSLILNYYSKNLPFVPKNILVSDISQDDKTDLEQFISSKYEKKVTISIPKIGTKKQLLNIAFQNCVELLKVNKSTTQSVHLELKELFNLYKTPNRYECFDNSHMMGQATVGAMVVYDQDSFVKDSYRLYKLEALDEYAQMKETLTRRVLHFKDNPPPDLWVIDGGATLLKLANDIAKSVGVNLDMVAISKEKVDAKAYRAKGSARDIIYTLEDKIILKPSDKRLQFLQKLRDEAHRVAINFHKKTKRKEDKQISLLEINGIGKAKVTKMLNYFGTFENIKLANIDSLSQILNQNDAKNVYNYFQSYKTK